MSYECKGVSHTAKVFLDGRQIAAHYNAYTAFSAIVRGVKEGEHTLEIIADNHFSEESALHVANDYMSYGGVSRPVVPEQVGDCFLEYVHVIPRRKGNMWRAQVEVCVCNLCAQYAVETSVRIAGAELHFPAAVLPCGTSVLKGGLSLPGAGAWSPESPELYTVTAALARDGEVFDDLIDRVGLREVRTEGGRILLNGSPLRIRGVCHHEDHPHFGCALPYSAMAYDLMLLRSLGANSVRTAHYPNDEVFLDLCDEAGILVWEENHARGLSLEQMQNPHFEEQAEQVIREMVAQHFNHPSIYIWGILNECASDTPYGKACYEKQFSLLRALDPSRPCSFASCKFKTDLCFGLPDVVSYNIYPLWYHDTPPDEYLRDLYDWVQRETDGAGKPFLVSEIGAGGIYGQRSSYAAKWSEEYQAQALRRQLEGVLSHPGCSGVYVWQLTDIRVSEEWWGVRSRTMNNKGVFDEFRRPKLCFEVVRQLFSEDARRKSF